MLPLAETRVPEAAQVSGDSAAPAAYVFGHLEASLYVFVRTETGFSAVDWRR
jgi:hypothetical protein